MYFFVALTYYVGTVLVERLLSPRRVLDLGDGRTVEVRSSMGWWHPSLADEDAWITAGGEATFEEWIEAHRSNPATGPAVLYYGALADEPAVT